MRRHCRVLASIFAAPSISCSCPFRPRPPHITSYTTSKSPHHPYAFQPQSLPPSPFLCPPSLPKSNKRTSKTYRGNQHLVTRLHRNSNPLSLTIKTTRTNSENLCLVELLDRGLGEENAAGRLGLCFYALHEDTVEEGR